jgi:fatty-acid desaturase
MIAVSHISGSRRFETRDTSTNNRWVAPLSFGDGWHNNHHAYPVSARHGLKWHVIDFTWYAICILKPLGFVSQIHRGERSAGKHPAKSLAAVER